MLYVALTRISLEEEHTMSHLADRIYPFSALVGQDEIKRALLVNAINPGIGGVLIR